MNKKIVLGCAVVLVLAVLVSAVGFYFFVWKPGGEFVRSGIEIARSGKDYATGIARLGEIAELDEGISDDTPYEAPQDGVLTAGQVERFMGVQRQVEKAMEGRLDDARARFEALQEGDGRLSPADVAAMLNEVGELGVEAKRVQVAALNEAGFSRQEYSWTKRQVYLALGFGGVDFDVHGLVAAARSGNLSEVQEKVQELADQGADGKVGDGSGEPVVPPANAELVEPYRESLERWAPLAIFGL